MVKMVELLLKIDVNELMSAANITEIIRPLAPKKHAIENKTLIIISAFVLERNYGRYQGLIIAKAKGTAVLGRPTSERAPRTGIFFLWVQIMTKNVQC